jgi:serine phosphatase RsbU (regulator of sigma subunit)/CHASE2 domain-containing sensor protein
LDAAPETNNSKRIMNEGLHVTGDKNKFTFVTIILSIVWYIMILLANDNQVIKSLRIRVSQRIEFNLRHYLGKTPPISSKIKILALDDGTFSYLKGPNPSILQWAELLSNLDAKQPRAILIDKMFAVAPPDDAETAHAISLLKKIKTPIYTGTYLSPVILKQRDVISVEDAHYSVKRLIDIPYAPDTIFERLPTLVEKRNHYLYGYEKWYANIFKGVGHITYNDDARVPPVILFNNDRVIPHLGLTFAESVQIKNQQLQIGDFAVPLDSDGYLHFNYRPPEFYSKQAKSMMFAFERARQHIPEKNVGKDDIVLIIAHFTGGTDFHEGTPFGPVPGGYLVASMTDGALTGSWLKHVEIDRLLIVIMCALGTVIGIFSGPLQFWLILFLLSSSLFAGAMYAFVYHAIVIPWIFPIIGLTVAGIINYANQSIQNELNKLSIKRDYYAEKARRLEEENKKIQLEQSLALGRTVQDLLLPKKYDGAFGQFSYEMKYTPSHIMGGDWVYIWNVSDEECRVIMGDVMGKGPSAAIPVAIIIGVLKEAELTKLSMSRAIELINERLIDLFGSQISSTCAAIVLRKHGRIDLYNAGTPGWFLSAAEKSEVYHLRSNPLGIDAKFTAVMDSFEMPPHGLIFTFTDGYLEGSRAIRRLIRQLNTKKAYEHDSQLIHEILMETGEGHRLVDDRSLLVIKAA